MITFLDLVQNTEFRAFVERLLAERTRNNQYSFPNFFPPLYRYRALSSYAVDDIIHGKLTITRIGEFNDLFDGALHRYGTEEECQRTAEDKWNELNRHMLSANLPVGILKHDEYVNSYIENLKVESKLDFRKLDYLGTYICCFSTERSSILMWSHYANYNTGICIEYDFNSLSSNSLLRKTIFPVAYSQTPIDLRDLLADKNQSIYTYPLDAAVLCAALNKFDVWHYENEWRLMWVLYSTDKDSKRFPIKFPGIPSSISFGYHFLKPFFYHDFKNKSEIENAEKRIKDARRLLNHAKTADIAVSFMAPSIGSYQLKPVSIPIDSLLELMTRYFQNDEPENMRFYYVVHDDLMELAEKEMQNA